MMKRLFLAAALACGTLPSLAVAQTEPHGEPAAEWVVKPEWIHAHARFLAGPELQGRGSATRDEAIAAAYVAARFEGYGLQHAPGMDGYLQKATIVRLRLERDPVVTLAGTPLAGAQLLMGTGEDVSSTVTLFDGTDPDQLPSADIVVATNPGFALMRANRALGAKGIKLLIVREGDASTALWQRIGGKPRLPSYLEGSEPRGRPSLVVLPARAFDAAANGAGKPLAMTLPGLVKDTAVTTNAVGYLPGTDADAGVILLSAHLDHLGVRADGVVMHGANDDASGTVAVLELAHALATGKRHRRGILFVAYGSEEIGGFGSTWFGMHPPVPIDHIAANIEFEMIGAQDPKLPAGTMMMTGFERSNLGPTLADHGALVTQDPYPDEHFFERSDNYSLALVGVVAHTISGWAVVPTYHTDKDTLENLDIPFMARAIQSLIGPVRWLADSDFRPDWNPGGRPTGRR